MEIPLFLVARLSLCLHYLHENRENNRIIFVEGLEEWMLDGFLKSAKIQPLEKCARKLFLYSFRLENSELAIGNGIICVGGFKEQVADRFEISEATMLLVDIRSEKVIAPI